MTLPTTASRSSPLPPSDADEVRAAQAGDPEAFERLRAIADAYLEMEAPWGKAPTTEIDEMELDQLRALGYAVP